MLGQVLAQSVPAAADWRLLHGQLVGLAPCLLGAGSGGASLGESFRDLLLRAADIRHAHRLALATTSRADERKRPGGGGAVRASQHRWFRPSRRPDRACAHVGRCDGATALLQI